MNCSRCDNTGRITHHRYGKDPIVRKCDCAFGRNVLQRANDIVQERGKSYGHPFEDFQRTAKMWSAILGVPITADQVIKCMICVKLSRLSASPHHQDSIDDVAGYTWCLDEVVQILKGVDITT